MSVSVTDPAAVETSRKSHTVRAAVAASIGAPLSVEQVEVGAPAAGELRIELTASGICHTDLSARDGQFPAQFPIVLGHEGTGTVTAVGEGVDDVRVGDRVVLTIDHCGQCRSCDRGRFWACANAFGMNVAGGRADGTTAFTLDGNPIHSHWFGQSSFAATILAPRSTAVVVADDVPAEVAAPLGCGIITGAGPVLYPQTTRPMDSLAVFGLGTVGLGAVMAARIRGVEQVIGVDPVASRRELARELGATDVVDPSTSDAVEEIQRITGGGADQALETSGAAGVLDVAVAATITGGHCGVIGAPPPGTTFTTDVTTFIARNISISGVAIGDCDANQVIPELVDHWRTGALPVQRLVTVFDMDSINDAIAAAKSGRVIKPVIVF